MKKCRAGSIAEGRRGEGEGEGRWMPVERMVDVSLPPPCRAGHVTVSIPTLAKLRARLRPQQRVTTGS